MKYIFHEPSTTDPVLSGRLTCSKVVSLSQETTPTCLSVFPSAFGLPVRLLPSEIQTIILHFLQRLVSSTLSNRVRRHSFSFLILAVRR